MTPCVSLALATAAFVGTHFLLSHPLRPALAGRLGERAFAGLYSLVALVTLGWMVFAWRNAGDGAPLWIAPLWWWPVASAIMLLALVLLCGAFVKNPAFPHPSARTTAVRAATGMFAITRHPMNWAFILWAFVHISLWGSPRNLIVASGILILAFFGSVGQDRKKRALHDGLWREWEERTSFFPFAGLLSGKSSWRVIWPGWAPAIAAVVLWLAITWYHAPMASPIGSLGHGIG